MSDWATTGKRWLPLAELVKQVPDSHNVIYVVVYQLAVDSGPSSRAFASLEEAQKEARAMTVDDLTWTRDGYAPTFTWEATDTHGTTFRVTSLVVETGSVFAKEKR